MGAILSLSIHRWRGSAWFCSSEASSSGVETASAIGFEARRRDDASVKETKEEDGRDCERSFNDRRHSNCIRLTFLHPHTLVAILYCGSSTEVEHLANPSCQ